MPNNNRQENIHNIEEKIPFIDHCNKKQRQCIIYCMRCQSLLSENSGQISIWDSNTECMQIEFEFYNQISKIRTSFNILNGINGVIHSLNIVLS